MSRKCGSDKKNPGSSSLRGSSNSVSSRCDSLSPKENNNSVSSRCDSLSRRENSSSGSSNPAASRIRSRSGKDLMGNLNEGMKRLEGSNALIP